MDRPARLDTAANAALLGAWGWLHGGALTWCWGAIARHDAQLNLVLLGLLLLAGLRHLDLGALLHRLQRPAHLHVPAVALLLLGAAGEVGVRASFPLGPLQAMCAGVGGYGLAGLYLGPARWVRGGPVALLALCLMPLSDYLDIYLGFPARQLTAHTVAWGLTQAHIAHLASGTILVLEGGAAYVDLPCSGVRSLWTGAVFLLGAAWLESRPVDRWLLLASALFTGLLFVANTARVAVLVLLHQVLELPLAAEIAHGPLGVVGFTLCCATVWPLLRFAPRASVETAVRACPHRALAAVLAPLLIAASLAAEADHRPSATPPLSLPDAFEALPLTPQERDFAHSQGGGIRKARFATDGLTGTVIVITSRRWLAQHLPRHCLQASGLQVVDEHPAWVAGAPVRAAQAVGDDRVATALWWFQSDGRITDDHTERIWAGLADDAPWTLVSVLVDGPVRTSDPAVQHLVTDLRAHVARQMESP